MKPRGAGDAEAFHERHAAMMAGTDRDAFEVEARADVQRRQRRIIDDEGNGRRFVGRRADDANTGNVAQALGCQVHQPLLMGGNGIEADVVDIIERGAQADRAGDVGCARLEFIRQFVIGRLLEADRANHVATPLIGGHQFQMPRLAVQGRRYPSDHKSLCPEKT